MKKLAPFLVVTLVALMSYGSVLINGAGFSHPDDLEASQANCYVSKLDCPFRPLVAMTYMANQKLGGWWMEVNLGLHLLCALLLLVVSESLFAACLFAAHPMAADAVASVAGRSALLAALTVLLALLFYRRFGWKGLLPGGILLFLAAGFHPGYLARTVMGRPNSFAFAKEYISALGSYIVPRMVIPVRLSANPEIHYSTLFFLLAGVGLVVAGWVFLRSPQYRLGLGLAILPLLTYAFVSLPHVFLEHRGYLALAGVSLVLGTLLPRRAALLIVPCFMVLAITRCEVYSSGLKLWKDAVEKGPNVEMSRMNLAAAYGFRNDYDNAEVQLKEAIRINPKNGHAWDSLDLLYRLQGQHGKVVKLRSEYFEFLKTPKGQELYGR